MQKGRGCSQLTPAYHDAMTCSLTTSTTVIPGSVSQQAINSSPMRKERTVDDRDAPREKYEKQKNKTAAAVTIATYCCNIITIAHCFLETRDTERKSRAH